MLQEADDEQGFLDGPRVYQYLKNVRPFFLLDSKSNEWLITFVRPPCQHWDRSHFKLSLRGMEKTDATLTQAKVNGTTKTMAFDQAGEIKNAKYDIVNFVADEGYFREVICVSLIELFIFIDPLQTCIIVHQARTYLSK